MPALLEQEPRQDVLPDRPRDMSPPPDHAPGGRDPVDDDHRGDGDPRRGNWPLPLAITLIVLLAALLTFLGMLTQIWANISGAQLPGA